MDQPSATDFHFMINPQSKNAEHVANWISEKLANSTDPASKSPGAPPLFGNDTVPHLLTFQSLIGTFSRAYTNPDEAVRDSIENAHLMEKDVGLLESVECRQRLTALLDWEIKPEDEKCQYQVSLAQELQRIVSRIRNFTKYRMWLMKAIWYGKSGIQHKYGYTRVNGAMRLMPTPLHRDHNGWTPINGDKLVFRYEDGYSWQDDSAYPHQMGIRVGMNPAGHDLRIHRPYKLEPVYDGLALFLKQYERDTFVVHKHMVEDASFHHSYFAGSIHGVGIRSKIYWEWFLKQEAFAFLMQYLERSAGGIEVWTYPMGDPKALAATQKAAREKMANGRNVVFFPKPMGDDSDTYKFEVIEPGAMGLDIMQNIIENYFGGRLKRYILGQELSTEAKATGMGSGVAEAHMDTLSQIVNFDARNLEETLTHELVRYIQQLNFPETMGWHMRMSLKTEDDKTQERMEALNSAYNMGARIAESEVFKTLGLSAPTSGEKILSMQSQQPAGIPGMPGMDPAMGGIPDGDNLDPNGIPEGGSFPDQENGDNLETDDDGEPDPVDLIRSMLDQYAQKLERDRYATQGLFRWEESLHPRETSTDTAHKAGQFTSKKKPQQQSLFDGPAPPKRQSGRFSGKPRSSRKALNDRIRSLFAEHAETKQGRLNFDDPIETQATVELPAPEPVREPEPQLEPAVIQETATPAPTTAPVTKRRMMGGSADSMKALAQPAAPPVQPKPRQSGEDAAPQESKPESIPAEIHPIAKRAGIKDMKHAAKKGVSSLVENADSTLSAIDKTIQPIATRIWQGVRTHGPSEILENTIRHSLISGSAEVAFDRALQEFENKTSFNGNPLDLNVRDDRKLLASEIRKNKPSIISAMRGQKQADPPSVETVPEPTNQPAPAVQEVPAQKSAPKSDVSQKPANIDTSPERVTLSDTERRNKLVEDNLHLVDQALKITLASEKGFLAKRDLQSYRSEAQFKLLEAASTFDPGNGRSFASYALQHMTNHGTKNLGRRKLDSVTKSATVDDEGNDLLSGVASKGDDQPYNDNHTEALDKAIRSLGNDAEEWLVRTWFSGIDPDGNRMTQEQATEAYNNLFGKSLTRQAIDVRARKIITKLQSSLGDADQYAAVRAMVMRYYRNEIQQLQKERYERRQDRVIREAAEYTETDPSDAQIKAGNYKKGRFNWNGMTIVIENPRGSTRRGVSPSGSIWRSDRSAHYGYISGTEGSDGDHVDIFMGKQPESDIVFVVHQCDEHGEFDEHKVMAGCINESQARQLYLSHYPKGWKCGEIVPMTVSEFKSWIESGECCQ
jgi:hypothetical protein